MAILIRWWRAVLRALSLRRDANSRWIQPANEITRAVLSGEPLWLPAYDPSVELPRVARPAVKEPEPIVEPAAAVPEAFVAEAAEIEAPAAAEAEQPERLAEPQRHAAPATRTRRRRSRRAA
jgi:hypothetical protein